MPTLPMTAAETLECYFLEARAKLLEVAATLDRIDRADGADRLQDQRRETLDKALGILLEKQAGRAERLQRLFSRPYQPDWMTTFGLK